MTNIIKREDLIKKKSDFVSGEFSIAMKKAWSTIESMHYKFEMDDQGYRRETVTIHYVTSHDSIGSYQVVDVTGDSLIAIMSDVVKAVM